MLSRIGRWSLMVPTLVCLAGCAELSSLRERTDAQEKQLASLRKENADFHDAYYKTKESLEGEVAKAQKTIEERQRELEEARTIKSQKEKDLGDQLRTRTLELEALKNESSEQKKLSDAQIGQLQQNMQSMTAERDAALIRLTDLDKKLGAEQTRSQTLTNQVAALKVGDQQLSARIDGLQKDLTKHDQDLKAEKDARVAAEKKSADLDAKFAGANKALADANKTLADARAAQNDLQKKADVAGGAAQDLQKVKDEKAALQAQLDKLKSTAAGAAAPSLEADARLKEAQGKLKASLDQAPDRKGVETRLDKSGLRLILPSDLLFDKGGIILSEAGKALLRAVAPAVADLAKERRVLVEGHTDNQPIVGDLPYADNWGLGFARADRVRAFLMESSVPGKNMTALTRAQYSPLGANDSAEGRAANRRVEIVIGAPTGG